MNGANTLRSRSGQTTAAIAFSTSGVALTLIPRLALVAAGLAVCCTGVFIAQASASAFVGTAVAQQRAMAIGLYSMFYYFGGSAGGSVPGIFYTRGGWWECAAFLAAVQIATVLMALLFWKPTVSASRPSDVKSISV